MRGTTTHRSTTRSPRRAKLGVVSGVAVVLIATAACSTETVQDAAASGDSTRATTTTAAPTTTELTLEPAAFAAPPALDSSAADAALTKLGTLAVKGRAPKTGYSRDHFGQAWSDDVTVDSGRNGCDTRNDILRRDLTAITLKPGSNGCTVQTGTLDDLYTDSTIRFVRGQDTSAAVQVDHVVALSDAWQKGAQQLNAVQRRDLANDPRNLQAVDGPTNQQKGAGDAATWLPPNKSYRCTYVSRQIDVKALYELWVTQAEREAMTRVLVSCGATAPVTTRTSAPTRTATGTPAPAYTPPPTTTEPPYVPAAPADSGGSVYYKNCSAARAAGAAPVYQGAPGYGSHLDRDGDGVGCE
ncbi:GmrSD restriction endonuclease domain-containing protein [Gordonia terrae]